MINQVVFSEIKDRWNNAFDKNTLHAPFLTWNWHNTWFQILGKNSTPYTYIIDDSIIASFVLTDSTLMFSGGEEIADYMDIIGPEEKKADAWNQIIQQIQSQNCNKLLLRNVPEHSGTIQYFKTIVNATIDKEDTTPQLQLPKSWEVFVESLGKKYTHELERKIRKFDREHPDVEIIESTQPAEDIDILFSLMERDEAKKAFLTPDMKHFFTEISKTISDTVSLRYIKTGDKKIAVTMSFIMDNTHFLYNSGFDKECCSIAGFYLKAINIKYAIEHGATTYNFLQGNERYKYELGGFDFAVYTVSQSI